MCEQLRFEKLARLFVLIRQCEIGRRIPQRILGFFETRRSGRTPEEAERAGVESTPEPANKANFRQRPLERLLGALLTSQSGISHLYQSGPRMKGTKSDWLVYNLNLLQVVLGQVQAELEGSRG